MAQGLEWVFELFDKVSGPSSSIVTSLDRVSKSMDNAVTRLDALGKASEHAAQKHAAGHGGWKSFVHTLHDVVEMSMWAAEGLKRIGEAIFEPRAFKETSLISLRALTGSAEKAKELFEQASQFAGQTGQSAKEMVGYATQFAMAGFKGKDINALTTAVSDMSAIAGQGAGQAVANHLREIAQMGQMSVGHIRALNNAGVSGERIYAIMGERLGMNRKEMKKWFEEGGQVGSKLGIFAITKAIADMQGGKLGSVTKDMEHTTGRLIESIKERFSMIFEGDGSNKPNFVKDALEDIKEMLAPDSPFLAGAKRGLDSLLDAFGIAGGTGAGGGLDKFLKSLKDGSALGSDFRDVMRDIGADARALYETLKTLGTVVSWIGTGFAAAGKGIGWAASQIADHISGEDMHQESMRWGSAIGPRPVGTSSPVALDPHQVLLQAPAMASGGIVSGATLAQIGEAGPEAVIPLDRLPSLLGSGDRQQAPSNHVSVNFSIHVGEHGEATASKIKDIVLSALTSTFEEVAIEVGVS